MTSWFRAVYERPLWTLAAVLAVTLVALCGLVDPRTGEGRLRIDPSTDNLIPALGPERELYERARLMFGTDEAIVVGIGAEDVFVPDVLERIGRTTTRLQALEGVHGVVSLTTAQQVREVENAIEIAPIVPSVPGEPEELERLRRETLANPLYAGSLVSRDSDATALLVSLDRMSDRELVESRIDEAIAAIAHEEAGGLQVWMAGAPHQKSFTSLRIARELSYMLPAILGVVALVLVVSTRSGRGVALPMITIVLGLIWTLGALGWAGASLNLVTASVPALILTIGFAYALHVVSEYQEELRTSASREPSELVRNTLSAVATPVLVTGITTAVGFVSLALHPIPAVREFGFYSVLGIGCTLAASLTAAPAILATLPLPRRTRRHAGEGWLERMADRLSRFAISRRRIVILVALTVLAVSVLGMTRIRVAIRFPGNLAADHPIRRDYEAINSKLGGATQLRVLLDVRDRDGILEPATLEAIRSFQTWLATQPDVGRTTSIVDYLMVLNQAMHGGDPEAFVVPATRRLASQLLLFGGSSQSERLLDARRQTTAVVVSSTEGDSDRIGDLVRRIEARLEEMEPGLKGSVTGSAVLLLGAQDQVSRGQLLSICAAFLLIYLVLVVMFTDPRVGLQALFPNLFPIAIYFGTLGFTGITLNPSTSLVGCLALGIAVDDTIHFFARFNAEARRLADEARGSHAALRGLIRPVTFTTVGLCLGFLVLATSQLGSQAQLGMLSAFTIAVAWLADVTVTPALCSGLRIVTLWDVLRLDLGTRPQEEIALFHGLKQRQARIFALMSDLRPVQAGERLFTEGEYGDDMFVIVEGELVAWVERDGERVEFGTMQRGDTVGEVGYFTRRRTTNVDVTRGGMLIRFDSEDLERLRRRYPRTAAIVYRNLDRRMAELVVRTMERLD